MTNHVSKLKWAWQAQFLSQTLLILKKSIQLLKMFKWYYIVWFFDFSTGLRFQRLVWECSIHICSCPWLIYYPLLGKSWTSRASELFYFRVVMITVVQQYSLYSVLLLEEYPWKFFVLVMISSLVMIFSLDIKSKSNETLISHENSNIFVWDPFGTKSWKITSLCQDLPWGMFLLVCLSMYFIKREAC